MRKASASPRLADRIEYATNEIVHDGAPSGTAGCPSEVAKTEVVERTERPNPRVNDGRAARRTRTDRQVRVAHGPAFGHSPDPSDGRAFWTLVAERTRPQILRNSEVAIRQLPSRQAVTAPERQLL